MRWTSELVLASVGAAGLIGFLAGGGVCYLADPSSAMGAVFCMGPMGGGACAALTFVLLAANAAWTGNMVLDESDEP